MQHGRRATASATASAPAWPTRGARGHATSDTPAWWLFIAGIGLSMTLSAPVLLALGLPYDAPWGPPLAKLHPGSYMLTAAWLCALARHGNPLAVAFQSARRQPALAAYLLCMLLVFVWVVFMHGTSGAAYIVQTLWMPAIALFTLDLLEPTRRRQSLVLVMTLLCCNAALALGEFAFRQHLLPVAQAQGGVDYFRSWALLGHPLINANITVALLPAVLMLPLQGRWRVTLQLAFGLLLVCAVLAFGARTALAVGAGVYGAQALWHGGSAALRGRYSYRQLSGGLAALMLLLALLVLVVAATGLGERIFGNLQIDNSASVRLRVWDAFDHLQGSDWWLGVAPDAIDRIATAMGLDLRYEAIENFWIYAFLQFGAIGFLPFITGMACLFWMLLRRAAPGMRAGVVVFLLVASTTNSLASKSVALTLLAVTVMAGAARPRRNAVATAAGRVHSPIALNRSLHLPAVHERLR